MPRTKKVSVARSAANQVKPLDRLDPESRKKFETICEDFDRQWEVRMEEFHDYQKKIEDDLERMLEMELLNLAKEVRKMPIEKLWESRKQNAKSGSEAAKPSRDSEDIKAEVENMVKAVVPKTETKRGRKKSATSDPGVGSAIRQSVRQSARKKAQLSDVSAFTDSIAPTPLMTSTVNRPRRGQILAQQNVLATPSIVPKFDINTPLVKTAARLAKPNEFAVSLKGSPLMMAPTTVKKRGKATSKKAKDLVDENTHVQIPIGGGKTMCLPTGKVDELGSLELDDEAKAKLKAIRENIDKLCMGD